jgi:hypothetical protein
VAETDTTAPTAASQSRISAQPARCSAAVLHGHFEPIEAGAGQRHTRLIVRNTGSLACTIYGYGGLRLATANGTPVPTNLGRAAQPGPALVRLAPNGLAAKDLSWTVIPTGSEPIDGACEPEANHANVIPPDETEPFTVPWNLGVVCHGGGIEGGAYYAP